MLFKQSSGLLTALLAATAAASPAPAPAPTAVAAERAVQDVPAVLAPRQTACPTYTRWESYYYTTVWSTTYTAVNGWSSLGPIYSTKTESELRTINSISTVYNPPTVTAPVTTVTSYVATVTSTFVYETFTSTTSAPGYAPSSECEVTTYTHVNPGTSSYTYSYDTSYATTWSSTTGHVTTTTIVAFTSSTRTVTTPGPTVYVATVTVPATTTSWSIILSTIWHTNYEKGCQSYACQTEL